MLSGENRHTIYPCEIYETGNKWKWSHIYLQIMTCAMKKGADYSEGD